MFYIFMLKVDSCEEELVFPLNLFEDDKLLIEIDKISNEQRDDLLGYTQTSPNNYKRLHSHSVKLNSIYFHTNYIVKMTDKTDTNMSLINVTNFKLDFVLKIVMGVSINDVYVTPTFPIENRQLLSITGSQLSIIFRKDLHLTNEKIDKIKNLLSLYVFNTHPKTEKLQALNAIINVAYTWPIPFGLILASFVSILEGIYVGNDSSELNYKFSLRMTRYLQKDYAFFKTTKEWYDSRSKFYHSGKNIIGKKNLQMDDISAVELVAADSLYAYLCHPNNFEPEALDKLLLGIPD